MTAAMAAHSGTDMSSIWDVVIVVWALGGFGAAGEFIHRRHRAMQRAARERREHRLEMRRLEMETQRARLLSALPAALAESAARHHCVIPNPAIVPVRTEPEGRLVAWLCTACDAQLPAGHSVSTEDL